MILAALLLGGKMKGHHKLGLRVGAVVLGGIGLYDLAFGTSQSPIPFIGNYLTQEIDVALLVVAAAMLYFAHR